MERRLLDYIPDLEIAAAAPAPASPRRPAGDEDTEMAFGAALLEVAGGAELDAFLAALVARVGGAALPEAPLGRALVAALRPAARVLLPIRSGDGAAAAGRGDLKSRAARVFGLELEGLSPEDKEFEVARHFVRFAADAAANAADAARLAGGGDADPRTQVQAALTRAARRHAPGLLRSAADTPARSGRWQRQGNRIIVLNG